MLLISFEVNFLFLFLSEIIVKLELIDCHAIKSSETLFVAHLFQIRMSNISLLLLDVYVL